MTRWEAHCYRCGETREEIADSQQLADEAIERFRRHHRDTCGASASIRSGTSHVERTALTGEATPR